MTNLSKAVSSLSDLIEKILEESISQSDFSDLTQQQFHYLQVIVRMKNPTLTELAGELGLTKPTVTVLVNKLVEKGYVTRIKSGEDRRTTHLLINKKGDKINSLREIAYQRMAEKIQSALSETETAIFTELLRKLFR